MLASKNILQTKKAQARTTCVFFAVWRKMPSLSEAPRGAITVSVGDFASRRTCAGTHGVLFAALPGSAGADDCIVSETEPAKGKGGNFWRKDMKKSQFSRIWARCNKIVRVLEGEAATFISRSRARCNLGACELVELFELSFPAHGRDATRCYYDSRSFARLSFPAHGRDATISLTTLSCLFSFHFPLTGEMQLLADVLLDLVHGLSFPAHGRDATMPGFVFDDAFSFHFPLTGEMQRSMALDFLHVRSFHFPLTGEMQRCHISSKQFRMPRSTFARTGFRNLLEH